MTAGMHRWTLWLALALMAATPLGAGCLDTAGATWHEVRTNAGFPPEEFSAKTALPEADAVASEWNADARLSSVAAVEWRPHGEAKNARGFNESFGEDPDVGNGRAPAWVFEYVTPNASLEVLVRADGTVKETDRDTGDHAEEYEAAGASPAWKVDSDTAIRKLAGNPEWDEGSRDARMVIDALELNGTESAWAFVALDERWQGVVGLVDPETGDVEGVYRWNMSGWSGSGSWNGSWNGGPWGWSWTGWNGSRTTFEESYEGTLTRLDPQERHAFPVVAEGQWIQVQATFSPANAESVRLSVLDPDGREIPFDCPTGAWGNSGKGTCSGRTSAAGEHTLVVALTTAGVYVEYEADLSVWTGKPVEWSWSSA